MRMQRPGEFKRTREQGQRMVRGCLILNWRPRAQADHSRLGVVTSRKVGNAVVRSRARRLIREAFRRLQPRIQQPCDIVFVARSSIRRLDGGAVQRRMERVLTAAHLLPPVL
jgi:ribonuclease P protein component